MAETQTRIPADRLPALGTASADIFLIAHRALPEARLLPRTPCLSVEAASAFRLACVSAALLVLQQSLTCKTSN